MSFKNLFYCKTTGALTEQTVNMWEDRKYWFLTNFLNHTVTALCHNHKTCDHIPDSLQSRDKEWRISEL